MIPPVSLKQQKNYTELLDFPYKPLYPPLSLGVLQSPQSPKQHIGAYMSTTSHDLSISVANLFSTGQFYRIPDYQRPFMWEDDNFEQLIDDFSEALKLDKNKKYFLGTLVLHEYGDDNFDIVDGQQRITALSIFLACLRDAIDDVDTKNEIQRMLVQPKEKLRSIPEKERLTTKEPGSYQKIVCTLDGTRLIDPNRPSNPTEERYRIAVKVFKSKLMGEEQETLEEFAKFVINNVFFVRFKASSFDDAFRLFSIVNDRGLQLRRIDILKAENLSPKAISDPQTRGKYATTWENIEEELGDKEFERLFNILRLCYTKRKPEEDLLGEFTKNILGAPGGPSLGRDFIDELEQYAELYDALFISRDKMDETPNKNKYRSLMYIMVEGFPANEWRSCILSYSKKFGNNNLLEFVYQIESSYLQHWVNNVRKDERTAFYISVLKLIAEANTPSDTIRNMENKLDNSTLREACLKSNFYQHKASRYILTRFDLQSHDFNSPREFGPRSIEHILPQNPPTNSEWRRIFNDKQRDDLVDSAGNLVLLSRQKNSSASNKGFQEKKTVYLEPRVSDFPCSLKVLKHKHWTPEIIKSRTKEISEHILDPL